MKGRKLKARLARRRKVFDGAGLDDKPGYHRPGSLKKPHPAGRKQ